MGVGPLAGLTQLVKLIKRLGGLGVSPPPLSLMEERAGDPASLANGIDPYHRPPWPSD